jgi:predicted nicotinamide N-methyase
MSDRPPGEAPSPPDLEAIERRFGFLVRSHRIGEMDLRVAQVDRVDDMVHEVYPEAVSVHGDAPVWMITWPAALGLAEYLVLNAEAAGRRVLELGCGTAAPGIALERAGAGVVCTDYDSLAIAMARHNAAINGCQNLETRLLDWYDPDLAGGFDLVVGSEIVYFEKSFAPLLSVLCRYATPEGRIILSDQGRPQMKPFLEMCRGAGFEHEQQLQTVHLPERSQQIRVTTLRRAG